MKKNDVFLSIASLLIPVGVMLPCCDDPNTDDVGSDTDTDTDSDSDTDSDTDTDTDTDLDTDTDTDTGTSEPTEGTCDDPHIPPINWAGDDIIIHYSATSGETNDFEVFTNCDLNGKFPQGDIVYFVHVKQDNYTNVSISLDFDGAVFLLGTCDPDAACIDSQEILADETTSFTNIVPITGDFYLVVDSDQNEGNVELALWYEGWG